MAKLRSNLTYATLIVALVAVALVAPVAEARQLSAARASFRVYFEGSYTAKATTPIDDCSRWVPVAGQPDDPGVEFFTMTASATDTVTFRSSKPASLKLAGPFGSFPLTTEGERAGRLSLKIKRASNVHRKGRPDGCDRGESPASPQQSHAGDCGSKSLRPRFTAASALSARANRSKAAILGGFDFNNPFRACEMPGVLDFGTFQQKAELAAIRATLPRVARLFTGSKRIVERGSATVRGKGTDQGSAVTYTLRVKVTLLRTKLARPRSG